VKRKYTDPILVSQAKASLDLALAAFQAEDYDQAIANCNCTVEYDPRSATAYIIRGRSYYQRDDDNLRAIVDFSRALKFNPNNREALYWRA